jgi:hypothetical protein
LSGTASATCTTDLISGVAAMAEKKIMPQPPSEIDAELETSLQDL